MSDWRAEPWPSQPWRWCLARHAGGRRRELAHHGEVILFPTQAEAEIQADLQNAHEAVDARRAGGRR